MPETPMGAEQYLKWESVQALLKETAGAGVGWRRTTAVGEPHARTVARRKLSPEHLVGSTENVLVVQRGELAPCDDEPVEHILSALLR